MLEAALQIDRSGRGEPPWGGLRAATPVLLATLVIVALALLLWQVANVLLLAFAAVLLALLLDAAACALRDRSPLSRRVSLALVIVLALAIVALVGWLFGAQIRGQFAELWRTLPEGWRALRSAIGLDQLQSLLESGGSMVGGVLSTIGQALAGALLALADVLLVALGGIFLAWRPDSYRKGLLMLVPQRARPRAEATLDALKHALRRWLLGQLISMSIVGVLTTGALYAIGVPSALALGLIAAIMEFVPFVGPILAAIPAILAAYGEGATLALWTAAAFLAIQQVESNVVMPLVERKMVSLPPALTLFAVLAMGVLFGALGVLLATPLTVAAFVLVRQVYVRGMLGERLSGL